MRHPRLVLLLVVLAAGLWSVAMGVLGLWLMLEPHSGLLGHPRISISSGLIALSAAQLVYLECVSHRLFPRPYPLIRQLSRYSNVVTLGISLCVLLVAMLGIGV